MNDLTLNEQYAVTCKGWKSEKPRICKHVSKQGIGYLCPECLPDYLSDDAELGRMVKVLLDPRGDHEDSYNLITYKGGHHGFCVDNANNYKRIVGSSPTPNEAAMRACIALKLEVPS